MAPSTTPLCCDWSRLLVGPGQMMLRRGDGGRFPLPLLARPSSRLCGPISVSGQMLLLHCEDGARTHLHWDEQDGGIVTNSSAASLNSPSVWHTHTAFAGSDLQAEYLEYFDIAVIIISGGGPNVTSQ